MERPVLGLINKQGLIVMFMCYIEKKNRIPLWGDLLLLILGFFFWSLDSRGMHFVFIGLNWL